MNVLWTMFFETVHVTQATEVHPGGGSGGRSHLVVVFMLDPDLVTQTTVDACYFSLIETQETLSGGISSRITVGGARDMIVV